MYIRDKFVTNFTYSTGTLVGGQSKKAPVQNGPSQKRSHFQSERPHFFVKTDP